MSGALSVPPSLLNKLSYLIKLSNTMQQQDSFTPYALSSPGFPIPLSQTSRSKCILLAYLFDIQWLAAASHQSAMWLNLFWCNWELLTSGKNFFFFNNLNWSMQLILPAEVEHLRTFWLTTSRKNPSIFILAIACCWHSCSETYQCSWRLYFHKNLSFGIPSSNSILRAHISPCCYMHSVV